MRIGIPVEIKNQEGRVALTPMACQSLIELSHEVLLQAGAGKDSGYNDEEYAAAGVNLVDGAGALYNDCDLLVKVKEPQPEEVARLRSDQMLFRYLHLAAEQDLTSALLSSGVTAIGFEIIEVNSELPLLSPMSQVAGRLTAQISAHLLHSNEGGKGLLTGGIAGTDPGNAVVIGAGQAGLAAANDLLCSGVNVTLLDINTDRLAAIKTQFPAITTVDSSQPGMLASLICSADIVIGAVLAPGKRAPVVVTREMVQDMPNGGVIVDIAIDQGGCIETSRPTSYDNPTYIEEGIVHFCVTNMPGAVPRTATQALSNAIAPYVEKLARGEISSDAVLQGAIYLQGGKIQYTGLK